MAESRPFESNVRFGFKEWASVCEALGAGRQVLILRRGGIHDNGGEFSPSHSDFMLLPTYWHQHAPALKPTDQKFLAIAQGHYPPPDTVLLSYHAVVTDSFRICSLASLERVREYHIWSDDVITERYHRWQAERIFGLIVRVYRLERSVPMPVTPDYAGCRSWIPLAEPCSVAIETPVLSDQAFDRVRRQLRELLADAEAWRPQADPGPHIR